MRILPPTLPAPHTPAPIPPSRPHHPPTTHPPQSDCGILLTTYETMRLQRGELLGVEWGYVVLDEGHKIRWARCWCWCDCSAWFLRGALAGVVGRLAATPLLPLLARLMRSL